MTKVQLRCRFNRQDLIKERQLLYLCKEQSIWVTRRPQNSLKQLWWNRVTGFNFYFRWNKAHICILVSFTHIKPATCKMHMCSCEHDWQLFVQYGSNRVVSLENVFASESFGSWLASLPYQADKVCLFWVGGAELCRTVDLQEQDWAPLCRAWPQQWLKNIGRFWIQKEGKLLKRRSAW